MNLEEVRLKREDIIALAAKYGVYNLRIFGSVARGEAGPGSDVDFLISLQKGRTLMELAVFAGGLKELLDRQVDVVVDKGLHHLLRERILNEAVIL